MRALEANSEWPHLSDGAILRKVELIPNASTNVSSYQLEHLLEEAHPQPPLSQAPLPASSTWNPIAFRSPYPFRDQRDCRGIAEHCMFWGFKSQQKNEVNEDKKNPFKTKLPWLVAVPGNSFGLVKLVTMPSRVQLPPFLFYAYRTLEPSDFQH
ncbi:hypothetical protein PAAG_03358 [Paracoccidioides lutzii Pb01]|uniref:Uncharacterized protein n=1 Tax=Paracoccidioides lutzii (strain ATCC MYA-826 / Pb01) TaxID=502779 RepID=C1GWY4_PARBA|nr:hypothetical protein PAAG_03358 [Paracoccidioides lutzii Pb01]EEH41072.1 hypothetical protein PAAG_03358 [Paracoccidioides lutzii Pb01]